MSLNILITPSGFKESLSATEVAECIEAGILRVFPKANITKKPLVDGGEGFTKALISATNGVLHETEVTGPVGSKVHAHFGFLGGAGRRTAVLEMAAAAGLRLVPADARDPLSTTTYGVGELIKEALDKGAERILIGCGDSGTNDGGIGMAQALGVHFPDREGNELPLGGKSLEQVTTIDFSELDLRLKNVEIDVACNWKNVLCGPSGVAKVFGPQKGCSPETTTRLEKGLENYAGVIRNTLDLDVFEMPGGGASGGLGTGLHALLGARLHPWVEIVLTYLDFESSLQMSDLVFSAEGSIDDQTLKGKIPFEVAGRARKYQIPVIVMAGTIGQNASLLYDHGIDAIVGILEKPGLLAVAIQDAETLLVRGTERAMRLLSMGRQLQPGKGEAGS